MRILRVAQKVYPDVKGGAPYHVHAMSRDQAEMGHDVTVLTVRHDPELAHVEERDGYTIVRYDPTVTLLGNDISAGVARYLWRAKDFDVMHAHSHLYFSTNLAALKRKLGDIPLAITNHGLYSQTASEEIFRWYLKTLGRWTFNRADVVFCYTEVDKERLREFGVRTDIEVVPNGIDTNRFTPEGPESELIKTDRPSVLFVGRLVQGKRPDAAIEAVHSLREEHPNITLYICGSGPLRESLEDQAGNELDDGIVFLGHLPYDEMSKVYRSVDVLVLPSRVEGFPRTILESIASGIPTVVSDLNQVATAIDVGQTVDTSSQEELEEALSGYIVEESSTHETSREQVIKHHQWGDNVKQTTEVLLSMQ